MRLFLAFILCFLATFSQAATIVCTNLVDSRGTNYSATLAKFTPISKIPQQYGSNTVVPNVVTTTITDSTFSIGIVAGGVYWFETLPANSYVMPVKVLVPSNDTNTYNLNQVIAFATNANVFLWTNQYPIVAGDNITFSTNGSLIRISGTANTNALLPSQQAIINSAITNLSTSGYLSFGIRTNLLYLTNSYPSPTGSNIRTNGGTLGLASSLTNISDISMILDGIPTWAEGKVFYDTNTHTLCYYDDVSAVTVNLAQENHVRVVNKTGSTISNGAPVTISGAQGNRPQAILSQSSTNTASTGYGFVGLATHDIANNAEGLITTLGVVNGVDTRAYAAGQTLFVSTNAGTLSTNRPQGNFGIIRAGVALNSTVNGAILVIPIDATHMNDVTGLTNALTAYVRTNETRDVVMTGNMTFSGAGSGLSLPVEVDDYETLLVAIPVSGNVTSSGIARTNVATLQDVRNATNGLSGGGVSLTQVTNTVVGMGAITNNNAGAVTLQNDLTVESVAYLPSITSTGIGGSLGYDRIIAVDSANSFYAVGTVAVTNIALKTSLAIPTNSPTASVTNGIIKTGNDYKYVTVVDTTGGSGGVQFTNISYISPVWPSRITFYGNNGTVYTVVSNSGNVWIDANGTSSFIYRTNSCTTFSNWYFGSYQCASGEGDPTPVVYMTNDSSGIFSGTWKSTDSGEVFALVTNNTAAYISSAKIDALSVDRIEAGQSGYNSSYLKWFAPSGKPQIGSGSVLQLYEKDISGGIGIAFNEGLWMTHAYSLIDRSDAFEFNLIDPQTYSERQFFLAGGRYTNQAAVWIGNPRLGSQGDTTRPFIELFSQSTNGCLGDVTHTNETVVSLRDGWNQRYFLTHTHFEKSNEMVMTFWGKPRNSVTVSPTGTSYDGTAGNVLTNLAYKTSEYIYSPSNNTESFIIYGLSNAPALVFSNNTILASQPANIATNIAPVSFFGVYTNDYFNTSTLNFTNTYGQRIELICYSFATAASGETSGSEWQRSGINAWIVYLNPTAVTGTTFVDPNDLGLDNGSVTIGLANTMAQTLGANDVITFVGHGTVSLRLFVNKL